MRGVLVGLACVFGASEAHADKFDLDCSGEYQFFLATFDNALKTPGPLLNKIERHYRVSMDVDSNRVRVKLAEGEWGRTVELRVSPDRYNFEDEHGAWVLERDTGRAGFNYKKSPEIGAFTGECERAEYTGIPQQKF